MPRLSVDIDLDFAKECNQQSAKHNKEAIIEDVAKANARKRLEENKK